LLVHASAFSVYKIKLEFVIRLGNWLFVLELVHQLGHYFVYASSSNFDLLMLLSTVCDVIYLSLWSALWTGENCEAHQCWKN
jgi:hypothetical protein